MFGKVKDYFQPPFLEIGEKVQSTYACEGFKGRLICTIYHKITFGHVGDEKSILNPALFSRFANQSPTLAWPSALISTLETGPRHH